MIYLAEIVFSGKHTNKVTTNYYLVFGFTKRMAWNRIEKKITKIHGELNYVSVAGVRGIM